MAKQDTREQAEERILSFSAEILKRLENNPVFQSLAGSLADDGRYYQEHVRYAVMPQLFDPKQAIAELLENIQLSKGIIKHTNAFAEKNPSDSEVCAEVVEGERWCIQHDLEEIKRIQKGEFEWVI